MNKTSTYNSLHLLPPLPPTHNHNRNSTVSLDYDLASSSDESDIIENNNSEDHKFWQVHSTTTVIEPPMIQMPASDFDDMKFFNVKRKRTDLLLANQVKRFLSSTFDEVDEEIESEWENSRNTLMNSLLRKPIIQLKI